MPDLIRIKIDVTKIDEKRLFKGKTGASYLDATLVPTSNSKYGDDYFIAQDVAKEEREAGVKGAILGNARIIQRKSQSQQAPRQSAPSAAPSFAKDEPDTDPIPF